MRLYLDDDMASALLAKFLRQAGHDVQVPADTGSTGMPDPAHFIRAIRDRRVLLSGNHHDFEILHDLVLQAGGHHPGIVVVRRDNDPGRDLTPRGIVTAIDNLEQSGVPLANHFHVLNQWR
jgi:predicted nuclease of predicted toxin-antitoxin system